MKLRKILGVVVAIAMIGAMTITASANLSLSGSGWTVDAKDLPQVSVGIDLYDAEEAGDGDLKVQLAEGVKYSDIKSVKVEFNGYEADGGFGFIIQSESLGWWDQVEIEPEEIVNNVATRTVNAADTDGYVKVIVTGWGNITIDNPAQVTLLDASGNVIPVYAYGSAPAAGAVTQSVVDTTVVGGDNKGDVKTGAADAAVLIGLSAVAVGMAVVARKRK